ncbi:hypothetical protein KCP74_05180 [Salmonella enterica subsp. enterica]|nr:hypothetical protein KCP74_05180 [Salmonella enterica subsp. enterica]
MIFKGRRLSCHRLFSTPFWTLSARTHARRKRLATPCPLNRDWSVDLSSLHQPLKRGTARVAEQPLCRLLRLAILFAGRRRDDLVPELRYRR